MSTLGPDERGSVEELVVLTPVLLVLVGMIVTMGALGLARLRLADAAQGALQAALVAPSAASARLAARQAAAGVLSAEGVRCAPMAATASLGGFRPGDLVRVQVSCRVALAAMAIPGTPGSLVLHARASGLIDPYRSVP